MKLTPEELIAKFPQILDQQLCSTKTDTCIEDMACPNCGDRDAFRIAGSVEFDVDEFGSEAVGDHEWEGHSYCRCKTCDFASTVNGFTFPGLDELVSEKLEEAYEKSKNKR